MICLILSLLKIFVTVQDAYTYACSHVQYNHYALLLSGGGEFYDIKWDFDWVL